MIFTSGISKSILTAQALCLTLALAVEGQVVKDADGNSYTTVIIGSQIWIKENLRATKYQDFSSIATTTPANQDISMTPIPSVYQWPYAGD